MEVIFLGSRQAQTSNLKLNSNAMETLKRSDLAITREVLLWQNQTKKRLLMTKIKGGPKVILLKPSIIG